jgi:hypothetical protein
VRTLATDEAAFGPLEYHDGSVWPHDNSLIARGLARAGRPKETECVMRALLVGLEPDPDERVLLAGASGLPAWADGLVLDGVTAFGRRWIVRVEAGAASVEAIR